MPTETLKEIIDRDGFLVLPGVLSPDEVERLRTEALQAVARLGIPLANGWAIPNAPAVVPEVRWLIHHVGVLAAVKEALGTEEVVFTLEADIHQNFVAGKWHKDTGEKVMPNGYFDCDPIGRDDCRVIKVAFYLQDHVAGGGLNVRVGSHRTASLDAGTAQPVLTRAGDAVIFDVRTTHRGRPATLQDKLAWGVCQVSPKARRAERIARLRQRLLEATNRPARVAVYLGYGIPDERTTTFASRNLERQRSQAGHNVTSEQDLIEELRSFGLKAATHSAP